MKNFFYEVYFTKLLGLSLLFFVARHRKRLFVFPQFAGGAEDELVEGEGGAEGFHDVILEGVGGDDIRGNGVG